MRFSFTAKGEAQPNTQFCPLAGGNTGNSHKAALRQQRAEGRWWQKPHGEWRAATADGHTYAAISAKATAAQSPAGQSTTPRPPRWLSTPALPVMPAVTVDRQNNARQCVNDKAGDISVRAAGISGCINHRHHRPQQKINAYRNGVAILVPAHLPNLRAVQPVPAADLAAFLIAMFRAAHQGSFADREQKDRPRQRDPLYAVAHWVRAGSWQPPSPQHWHLR